MAQIIDLGKIRFNWAGTYNESSEYSYNDLVKYGPNLYAFTANTAATGVTPTNTGSWVVVTEGIDYRGTYTSGTKYYFNDIVSDGTSTYIVLTEHTASTSVALGNTNLEVIALGQSGLPNQSGQTNQLLATDGTTADWVATTYLSKTYTGNAQGQGAYNFETAAELTDVMSVFSTSTVDFGQFAIVNTSNGANASTDLIVYAANGTNDSGWIDMGITSEDFDAETFGITGPHDGYMFMSAPRAARFDVVRTSIAGGQVTLTTGSAHGFTTGDQVRVEDIGAPFAGLQTVTATPTPTSFRYATDAAPQSQVDLDPFASVYRPFGNGNLVFATDETGLTNKIVFAAGGFVTGRSQMEIMPDQMVSISIDTESTDATSGALVVSGGIGISGAASIDGLVRVKGSTFVGEGAEVFEQAADLTNASVVVEVEGLPYAQLAVHSPTASGSTDVIVYANNGTDTAGWMDMGITGNAFAQAEFGLTGPNDAYVFFEAPEGTTGKGNMVIATGDKGSENKIIIAAGGFATGREQITVTPDVSVHIEIDTPSTSPTTGALTINGGVGIVGDVNIAGNITFGGSGTSVTTENLSVSSPLIFAGAANPADSLDLGLVGEYKVGAAIKYTALTRDATDGVWKLVKGISTKPETTVDFAEAGLAYADMQVNKLQLGVNPTEALGATPKQYVDAYISDGEIAQLMGAY